AAFAESADVAVDAAGNVVLYGRFSGTLDFGGGPLMAAGGANQPDVFLAKFDPLGNPLWSERFGSAKQDQAYSVATGPSGEIVISGLMYDTLDFGNGVVIQNPGPSRAFVAKLDSGGVAQWAKNGERGYGYDLAVDTSGNVV